MGEQSQHYRDNSPPASISPEPPSAPKPRHPKAMCSSCSLSSTFSHRMKEQHWSGKHSEPKMPWSPALSWPQLHHANQSPGALVGRLMLVGLGAAWVCISDRCPGNAGWAVLRPHSRTKGLMRMWEGRWLLWSPHVFWNTESDHISPLLFVVRVKFNLPAWQFKTGRPDTSLSVQLPLHSASRRTERRGLLTFSLFAPLHLLLLHPCSSLLTCWIPPHLWPLPLQCLPRQMVASHGCL